MKTINGGIKGKNINTWIGSRLATKRLTARLKYLYSSPVPPATSAKMPHSTSPHQVLVAAETSTKQATPQAITNFADVSDIVGEAFRSPVHILVDLAGVVVSIDGKMAASDGGDNSAGCHVIDQTKSHMNKPY
jgi:uncharacterized Zn-binding protein involved in type VI secretion